MILDLNNSYLSQKSIILPAINNWHMSKGVSKFSEELQFMEGFLSFSKKKNCLIYFGGNKK